MATTSASKKIKSEEIKSIPHELIFEIFSLLPIKSLMRYKCASKFYNSLVFESNFVDMHYLRSMTRPGGKQYIMYKEDVFYATEMKEDGKTSVVSRIENFYNPRPTYSRLMCVNGLVCLLNDVQDIAIYNFNTREIRFIRTPVEFANSNSYGVCSIGFEPEEKKYKLWLTLSLPDRYTINWVFTLNDEDKSWRQIKCNARFRPILYKVCASGVIYMLSDIHCHSQFDIIAFDVRVETFRIFIFSDALYWDGYTCYDMIELKGKLAILNYKRYSSEDQQLWILENAQNEYNWENHIIQVPSQLKGMNFMCTSYDKEIIFSSIMKSKDIIYMCYDFTTQSWREFGEIGKLGDRFYINNIFCFVENLFYLG